MENNSRHNTAQEHYHLFSFRVIFFTKKDDPKFRDVIESLSSATSTISLGILRTLILYENGIKPAANTLSQHYIHLLFHKDSIATATLISGYIEAFRMAKGKIFFFFIRVKFDGLFENLVS